MPSESICCEGAKMNLIKDNKLTDLGERACELVYEFFTGKCWHRNSKQYHDLVITSHDEVQCEKCDVWVRRITHFTVKNPPLAFSLDAWREHIFPKMDCVLFEKIIRGLLNRTDCGSRILFIAEEWLKETLKSIDVDGITLWDKLKEVEG
jgi:hypothetical protein